MCVHVCVRECVGWEWRWNCGQVKILKLSLPLHLLCKMTRALIFEKYYQGAVPAGVQVWVAGSNSQKSKVSLLLKVQSNYYKADFWENGGVGLTMGWLRLVGSLKL